jgi:uncharacterized membrane protein
MMSVPGVALRERLVADRVWRAGSSRQQLVRRWFGPLVPAGYDVFGLAAAAFFVCLSLTPSLLPRGPAFQRWLSAIVATAGYGLGVLVSRLLAGVLSWRPGPGMRRIGRIVVQVGAPVAIGVFLVAASRWQVQAHRLVGQEVPGAGSPLLIVVLMVIGFVVLVGVGRLARRVTQRVARRLARHLPVAVAGLAAAVLVTMATWAVVDQIVMRLAFTWVDRVAAAANDQTPTGLIKPAIPERSGSPGSMARWDELGYEGRVFVSGGPTMAQLSGFAGTAARTPIRVYVGVQSATDAEERAELALAELHRTKAFDRAVLCIVSTTGTGWVDRRATSALEYLYAGDTAIVATQYSYLPSAVSFVLDDDQVEAEARALFGRIHDYWARLPPADRPRLLLYGESLGSNGGQAPFASLAQLRASVDGALFAGAPRSNNLRQQILDKRDPGSPEWLPTKGPGQEVMFAADETTLNGRVTEAGEKPRILFLQHANDPVVWWSPQLLLQRPDWLSEPRGKGVSTSISWYPIVTFWQVTADLVTANHVPAGAGHRYGDLIVRGWAAVAPPPGWTAQDTLRLTHAVS